MKYETFRKACVDTDGTDLFPLMIGVGIAIISVIGYATYDIHRISKED